MIFKLCRHDQFGRDITFGLSTCDFYPAFIHLRGKHITIIDMVYSLKVIIIISMLYDYEGLNLARRWVYLG